ncbi:glycosyltransferase [Paenibacillus sp. DMB5]|uniref:glycosyltransferase n=1 Tax=Paenibacillus sp. DMB5 TaxID=1780103 RepID=UPI00076C505F|nr:glycosyltransferase [Paenibacillus sp. DMB5]KUP23925.1 hypothetical protein AWJ19_12325 [Paenibacillus sp. DMB5]
MLSFNYLAKNVNQLNANQSILFVVSKEIDYKFIHQAFRTLNTINNKYVFSSSLDSLIDLHIDPLSDFEKSYLLKDNQIYTVEFTGDISNKREIKCVLKNEVLGNFDIVCFDGDTNYKTIQIIETTKPKYLYGEVKFENFDYYEVWMRFSNFCEFILLSVTTKEYKNEIFEWTKGEYEVELSIILPVYNVEKYLIDCFKAIANWKVDFVEFLAVNDGSPDSSLAILEELAKQDSRIKIIDKPNGGCASARQMGLENSKGRYVGFIDPDDFTTPDMFLQLHRRAMLGQHQVAYCGYNEFYETTKTHKPVLADMLYEPYDKGTTDEKSIRKLITDLRVGIWRGIYSRQFLIDENINFNIEIKRFDDLPFKVEIFARAKSVVAIPEFMYFYRLQRPGQDIAITDERLYVHFQIFDYLDKKMDAGDREIMDLLQLVKIETHLWAIKKLEPKYKRKYIKLMKKDLRINAGFIRNMLVSWRLRGSRRALTYSAVYLGLTPVIKMLSIKENRIGTSKKSKYTVSKDKLRQFYE